MTEFLIYAGVFVGGGVLGYVVAAVTEFRFERKLDKKFWAFQDEIREIVKR